MADADKLSALLLFFRRFLADEDTLSIDGTNYTGLAGLKGISKLAALRVIDGTTMIEVQFEGGGSRSVTNCDPHVLLAACEAIIAEKDEDNPLGQTDLNHRYADMSGGRIES